MRLLSRLHAILYRTSRGRIGRTTSEGLPVLLLTTRGRRSGRWRTTPLVYHRDGGRLVVCGGSGGTQGHPAWFLNLAADDRVVVQVEEKRFPARARELEGEDRERLWRAMAARAPLMDRYQRSVQRRVPLVALEADPAPGRMEAAQRADPP